MLLQASVVEILKTAFSELTFTHSSGMLFKGYVHWTPLHLVLPLGV